MSSLCGKTIEMIRRDFFHPRSVRKIIGVVHNKAELEAGIWLQKGAIENSERTSERTSVDTFHPWHNVIDVNLDVQVPSQELK
jgi:hypothetical protein